MAKGIVDCSGKTINIGDRVRTEHGDVIEVMGGIVSERRMFDAEKCTLVTDDIPLTGTGHAIIGPIKGKDDAGNGDCFVWGS